MTENINAGWKRGDPIKYVQDKAPDFDVTAYEGDRYEAMVPDTLDLQERAALAVNALTESTDPEADYEMYWLCHLGRNPIIMQHDFSDHCQCKFMEALPLMRVISGSIPMRASLYVVAGPQSTSRSSSSTSRTNALP